MSTHWIATRSLPVFLFLMAIAVILMLAGSAGAGFVMALIVVGIAAVLLGSMLIADVAHDEPQTEPRSYRRTQAGGL